jgi:hypothetical protein
MPKLIVVFGVTGQQGGSMARRFLEDASYRVRGVTRNATSDKALSLAKQGIDIVQADLEDVESLKKALVGANLVFTVTDYWEPFWNPVARAKAAELGLSPRRYAYDVELRQGKNLVDAIAAAADALEPNGLIASTLGSARKCTGGRRLEAYHFDSKADVFPAYVEEKYPELAKKLSCVQTGYFMNNRNIMGPVYSNKVRCPTQQMMAMSHS